MTAIFLAHILDDVCAAIVSEVDVDIRRIDAFGIQEAFEQQAVADRIHIRDLQQIGDERAGGTAARLTLHARIVFAAPANG